MTCKGKGARKFAPVTPNVKHGLVAGELEARWNTALARVAEVEGKLAAHDAAKRLYDAIENGVADLSDPMLKDRIAELKAVRDQARTDAGRAQEAIERAGPSFAGEPFLFDQQFERPEAASAGRDLEHPGLGALVVEDGPDGKALEQRAAGDVFRKLLD